MSGDMAMTGEGGGFTEQKLPSAAPQHASVATHLTDENGKLPLWIKTTFAVPRFTIRASYIIQSAYVVFFYETIGAKLTYIAAYVAIARSFDVITDPLMGWLSDNTHSRFGRRKPYMVVGTVLYNTMLLFLLNPPRNMGHPAISHWFGMTYTLFYLFDTFTSIPYYAFGMELTNDFDERDQVWFWNQLSGNLGTLVGIFLPVPLTAMTSNLYDVWLITGLMFVIVHAGGMAANVLLIPEKPEEEKAATLGDDKENGLDLDDESGGGGGAKAAGSLPSRGPVQDPLTNATADPNPAPFVVNLLRCMRNEPFDKIIKSYFLDYLGLGMISAMLPFYVGYVLLRPEGGDTADTRETVITTAILGVCVFVAAFLSVPVWEEISRRNGKYWSWIYYSIWNAITCPFFAVCGTSKTAAYIVAGLNGSAVGGQFLLDSIVNDVAEYDTMLHGDSIEGCFVAIQTFVPKIVLVAAMSLPFAIIVALGFNSSRCTLGDDHNDDLYDDAYEPKTCDGDERAPEEQTATIRWLIVTFFCLVPTLATLVSIYYKLHYPIKTPELALAISDARAAHSRGEAAIDPLTEKPLGPLCICRIDDPLRREALMALAHFPKATVEQYLAEDRTVEFMEARVATKSYVSMVLLAGCTVLAITTFPWLDIESKAWVPIVSCVGAGALLVFVFVLYRIKSQLDVLRDKTRVTVADVNMYLDKLNGKGGVNTGS